MRLLAVIYLLLFGTMLLWISASTLGVQSIWAEKEIRPRRACREAVKEEIQTNEEAVGEDEFATYKEESGIDEDKASLIAEINEEKNEVRKEYSEGEIEILERIVEAEAGGEDAEGKLLVANVVLNRVRNEAFPDTIEAVVFQQNDGVTQFSPIANGRYEAVIVSEESREAVKRALEGEDISEGALYFAARKYANPKSMKWFDDHLTMLFQHGGHEFFK